MSDENAVVSPIADLTDVTTQHPAEETRSAGADGANGEDRDPQATATEGEPEQGDRPRRKGGWARQNERLKREVEELKQTVAKLATPAKEAAAQPADDAKFYEPREGETQLDYDRRIIRHETQQALKAERDAESKSSKEAEQRKSQETAEKAWKVKEAAARADIGDEAYDDAFADFEEDVQARKTGLTQPIIDFCNDSEDGGKVFAHLITHRDELEALRKMGPAAAARALTKIEAQFAQQEPAEKPAPRTTQAPTPARPVSKTSGSAPITDPMQAAMKGDYKLYDKLMTEREKRQR